MKKIFVMLIIVASAFNIVFSQEERQVETRMEAAFFASTRGEMAAFFRPQWKFPFLQGESPLTSDNNIALKLEAGLSPIYIGLTGNADLTVFPFLFFRAGGQIATGWNYDLFGEVPLIGLGVNKRKSADDKHDGVIGNGLDGVAWDLHFGSMLQFDLAAFFPGDWNHVVAQAYNEIQYFAYTKANDDEFWYFLGDDGMNRNAFRYKFTAFVGYMMPIFVDMVGVQFEGTLPFYNNEIGSDIRDVGFSFTDSFIVNFKINTSWSIMTIVRITNGFADPVTSDYEREWGFDRVQFIATWRIK
jgi:hypothetical protein